MKSSIAPQSLWVWSAAAALVLLAGCSGPSATPPAATSAPGSPDAGRLAEPPRYLLPPGALPEGYAPVEPAVYDPGFLTSELGVAPERFEDLPYLTEDRSRFVHVQVADFNTSGRAEAAYRNYIASFPEGLCPNRSTLALGAENLLCDNRGRSASYVAALKGRSLLVAFTHDSNRTPFGDLEAFARLSAARLEGA
ncbi:MAG: hypothetical protein QXT68_08470 [Halobacteria archaeon]